MAAKEQLLFLYPGLELTGTYRDIIKGVGVPPQGICQLAAVTRDLGHPTAILDAMVLGLDAEKTVAAVLDRQPDIVGISCTTMQIIAAGAIAAELKRRRPGLTIIVGGPHVTVTAAETMARFPAFDIACLGEGEETIAELLAARAAGMPPDSVAGLAFRRDGQLVVTAPRGLRKELDTLPMPAWDLLPDLRTHYQQSVARVDRVPAASLTTSRGCPYRCIFCARNVFGVSHRAHSAPYVLRMVDYLVGQYGVRSLAFEDENFVVQRDRLQAICQTFIDRKLDLTWSCAARVDLVRADDLALMRRAGCTSISYGIESGCQRILDNLGKGLKLDGIERGVALTNAAGIRPRGYFIIGSPGEDLASIAETIAFVRRVPFAEVQMSHMCPFPGTELYDTAAQHGTFDNDWAKLNIWTPVFVPRGLTREELVREHKRFYRAFYFRPRPILAYLLRALHPAYFAKYVRDGLNVLRFMLKNG